MENQDNEISIISKNKTSMNKTQNTFLSTGSTNKFKINTLYRVTSPNNIKYLPPIQHKKKLTYKSLNKKPKQANMNYDSYQNNYESNNLKQRLSDSKVDMNMKNGELIEYKIKNFKLSEENKNIKILIALVLDVDMTQAFSKNEIMEKIANCSPTEEQKKKLKFVLDFIKLKIDIGLKKERIAEISKQIEYYTKNSKTKILTDLDNEYMIKNGHQVHIQSMVDKMKKEFENNKIKLEELKSVFITKKNYLNRIKNESNIVEKDLREIEDERDKLESMVLELREKQRKAQDRIKIGRYKNENNEFLNDKKINLDNIDEYILNRDSKIEEISQRKFNIKNYEKEIADLDKKINELNVKNGELTSKMDIYNKEGPKLIQKSYEPLSNQKNLQDLEEKLKIFKKEYEMTKNEHEGKQSTIQSELDKQKIQIEENNKVINKNNEEKNGLQNELNELNQKLNDIKKNLEEKDEEIKIAEQKLNNLVMNEEKIKRENEEKEKLMDEEIKKNEENDKKEQLKKEKEYKKDIYSLQKQIEIYKGQNKILEEETKNLKNEIDGFDNTINQNSDIDEKIKEATDKLNKLKPN